MGMNYWLMNTMRTVDKQFMVKASLWERLRRDIRLLRRMARMLWTYIWIGGRIRRAYRAKEAAGEVYWVDEQ
jgi:hypothetical protein